jgi:hypothetical protein
MAIRSYAAGAYRDINALIGASSQDEEIESELKGLGIEAPQIRKA